MGVEIEPCARNELDVAIADGADEHEQRLEPGHGGDGTEVNGNARCSQAEAQCEGPYRRAEAREEGDAARNILGVGASHTALQIQVSEGGQVKGADGNVVQATVECQVRDFQSLERREHEPGAKELVQID